MTLRLVERVATSERHPNAAGDAEVHALRVGDRRSDLRPGNVYCFVLTDGAKARMTIEAYGVDDAHVLQELKNLMEAPAAFGNHPEEKKRRALWDAFRKTGALREPIRTTCSRFRPSTLSSRWWGSSRRGTSCRYRDVRHGMCDGVFQERTAKETRNPGTGGKRKRRGDCGSFFFFLASLEVLLRFGGNHERPRTTRAERFCCRYGRPPREDGTVDLTPSAELLRPAIDPRLPLQTDQQPASRHRKSHRRVLSR